MKADRNKVLWRCRRGIRELDSILMPFAENCYDELSALDKARLQTLLGYQDTQLLEWILGRTMPNEEELHGLINSIILYSNEARRTESI